MGISITKGAAYSFFVRGLFGVTFYVWPLRAYRMREFWRIEYSEIWPRMTPCWVWGPFELMLTAKQ